MLHFLFALQIAVATPAARPTSPRDSGAIVNRVRDEASDFLWVWRFYWEASESVRHFVQGSVLAPARPSTVQSGMDLTARARVNVLHCHPDGRGGFPRLASTIEAGGRSLRAFCPVWAYPRPDTFDERIAIDDALIEPLRSGITLARGELIADLESAARALPSDAFLAGQRVRFALDQRDSAAVARGVSECAAERAWCIALAAYVRHTRGEVVAADSLFEASLASMTRAERCDWADLEVLFDDESAKSYRAIPCDRRDSVNSRVWWLSDPLYTEPGNERRAEHFARMVMITLREAVEPSEHWNWSELEGGNALRAMVLRYGWPTYAWWGGPAEDRGHYGYLGVLGENTRWLGVFTTQEYSSPRFHPVPDWPAVASPWQATPSMWNVAASRDSGGKPDLDWWPIEHYPRAGGALVQIPEHQAALLRRSNDVLLAVATDLSRSGLDRRESRTATGTLIVTPAPDTMRFIPLSVSLDSTTVWRAAIAPRPAIVGLEVRAQPVMATVARIRFGIDPPPALSAMHRGEIAISPPVLVRPARSGGMPDSDPATALSSMLGTTRLSDMQRVGVYWETYGIRDGDSVDVAVTIERRAEPSALRRLGTALHVADHVGGSVTVRWHEPQPGFVATTLGGLVPIQGRNVSIDLSQLAPDKYSVTVTVTRKGQTASATRDFEIVR